MARRIDFREGLPVVLMRAYWARGTDDLDSVLEMLTEARMVADEIGDIELQAEASEWRLAALIARGDLAIATAELADVLAMARRMHQPFIIHVAEHYGSVLALCRGDLAEAEQAAERSREWSKLLHGRDASGVYGVQMFSVRREQGRLAELAPVVRVLAGGDRRGGAWRPGLAALMAELGMLDEARAELDQVRRDGLTIYRRGLWAASLSYVADACTAVADAAPGRADLRGAAAAVGRQRRDRSRRCLLRVGRPLPGHAGLDLRRPRSGRAPPAAGDRFQPQHGRRHLAGTFELRVRTRDDGCGTAGRPGREGRAGRGDRVGRADRDGGVGRPHPRAAPSPAAISQPPDGLSQREVEILLLVAGGRSNREIGSALHISEHTAANHIRSILRKTGCANRTEAASYAHTRGLTGRA